MENNLNSVNPTPLYCSIRDKEGNEISYRSGTNPNDELYLRKFNKSGICTFKGTYKNNKREGLVLEYDEKGDIKLQSYFKNDINIEMPVDIKLYMAVKAENIDEVKKTLTYHPNLINLITPNELQNFPINEEKNVYSILELSLKNKNSDICNFLVDSGARLDNFKIVQIHTNKEREHDPIMTAISNNKNAFIENIISKNPNLLEQRHLDKISEMIGNSNKHSSELKTVLSLMKEANKNNDLNRSL